MTLKNNPFYIIDYFVEKFMQNNKNDINSKEERKTTVLPKFCYQTQL